MPRLTHRISGVMLAFLAACAPMGMLESTGSDEEVVDTDLSRDFVDGLDELYEAVDLEDRGAFDAWAERLEWQVEDRLYRLDTYAHRAADPRLADAARDLTLDLDELRLARFEMRGWEDMPWTAGALEFGEELALLNDNLDGLDPDS